MPRIKFQLNEKKKVPFRLCVRLHQKTNKNTNWKRIYYILTHFSLVSENVNNERQKSIFVQPSPICFCAVPYELTNPYPKSVIYLLIVIISML